MKLDELTSTYSFHDSLLESVVYDEDARTAVLEIDFCNWAQDNYTSDMPETMMIQLHFNNVKEISNHHIDVESSTISNCHVVNSNKGTGIVFLIIRDYPGGDDGVDAIQIIAESVNFKEDQPI